MQRLIPAGLGDSVPDCTVAAIPGLTQAPAAPKPIDASGSVVAAGASAGALAGSGSVTPAGEYRYRIPLDVPPGRAGMAPSLALVYSSRGKNGHLGVGWQLEGLSEIDRCPRTFAVDGVSNGVRLDDHDAFCLDGHELVPLGRLREPIDRCRPERVPDRGRHLRARRVVRRGQRRSRRSASSRRTAASASTIPVPIPSDSAGARPATTRRAGRSTSPGSSATDQDRAGNSIRYSYAEPFVPFGAD